MAANTANGDDCMVFLGKNHSVRAQVSSEFVLILGVVLMISVMSVAMIAAWPGLLSTTKQQRSNEYWSAARPFSVTFYAMKPNVMIMAIENNDPTTLTISGIWLDGVNISFSNHTVPYTSAEYARCSGGTCNMTMAPGVMQIITTQNITTSPPNPCGYDDGFQYGTYYEMGLAITYYGTNSSNKYNQTSPIKLSGTCSGWGGCEMFGCCGIQSAPCCAGGSCNDSSLACDGSFCVTCGVKNAPCCAGGSCNGNLSCQGSPAKCICGSAAGLPCCGGTSCTGGANLFCNATTLLCQACGGAGQPCCSGNCGASLVCNASSTCVSCGSSAGQPCCSGNDCSGGTNLSCNIGTGFCESCGGSNQLCCAGNCNTNYQCTSGTCTLICGGNGQACCPPNNTCNSGSLGCDWSDVTCKPGGSLGEPCVAGTPPYQDQCVGNPNVGCDMTTHTCVSGCGVVGAPCCDTVHTCTVGAGSMTCNSATDTCYRCGQYGGDPCCAGSPWNYCEVGISILGCDHTDNTCVSCGALSGPCCGSSHYCPYTYNVCYGATDLCGS